MAALPERVMTEALRTSLMTSAIKVVGIAFAGAVIGGCAVGLAAQAQADSGNCDPLLASMTPQPILSCNAADAPPPAAPPAPDPVNDVAVPPQPGALPAGS
jgi:hypothetical protein